MQIFKKIFILTITIFAHQLKSASFSFEATVLNNGEIITLTTTPEVTTNNDIYMQAKESLNRSAEVVNILLKLSNEEFVFVPRNSSMFGYYDPSAITKAFVITKKIEILAPDHEKELSDLRHEILNCELTLAQTVIDLENAQQQIYEKDQLLKKILF